jgi:hypothetical protein
MTRPAIDPADLSACREAIRTGSYSFHAASRLLPAKVRDPALALYAFCRLADDAVDEGCDKVGAVLSLRDRLDLVYAGRPQNAAADRAFAAVVAAGAWWALYRRVPWRMALIATAIALPWVCFAAWFYGTPVPHSVLIKLKTFHHYDGYPTKNWAEVYKMCTPKLGVVAKNNCEGVGPRL